LFEEVDFAKHEGFKHALVFFGGLEGIEGLLENEENSKLTAEDVDKLFDYYLNTCPEQGTRTIRTEEAILISMALIYPMFRTYGLSL
jgi:predicted SPOUT superfamily RNA methylase MTH1